MSTHRNLIYVLACAGLVIAPSAWIINTQLGQTLPYLDCQHQASWSALASTKAISDWVNGWPR